MTVLATALDLGFFPWRYLLRITSLSSLSVLLQLLRRRCRFSYGSQR